ncbi:hypothetical protein ACFV4K_24105 [Nocardia sp. NPDC059764]|uniref:hypothetical protein n=1 Tax=Nocardia sp. NPDC059764 TaxID=3346939 RepID=UPI00365BC0EC
MGVDIFPAIAQWDRLAETLNSDGMDGIWELFWAIPSGEELGETYDHRVRFLWPPSDTAPWYGECTFRGLASTGSWDLHWALSEVWDEMNGHSDLPTDLAAQVDRFIARLVRHRHGDPVEQKISPGLPMERIDVRHLRTACSPSEVAELARVWGRCADRLEELRPALTAEVIARWPWIADFDQLAMLLQDWGEIVTEADRRGWGLFYLN